MDELTRRLYGVPPEDFVAARDEAARAAGDPDRAVEIRKLRKPSLAAWIVNLLAIHRPELLAELAELSSSLRSAQRELRGDELRELSGRRRAVLGGLVAEAGRLARTARPHGNLPLGEVETTLSAALAEPEAAELVRSGRLIKSIEYAGFGEVPRPQLRLITSPAPGESTVDTPNAARVERELAAARTAESEAGAELARAEAAEHDATAALAALDEALTDLRGRRAAADEELARRKQARKSAEKDLATARRRLGAVEAARESSE